MAATTQRRLHQAKASHDWFPRTVSDAKRRKTDDNVDRDAAGEGEAGEVAGKACARSPCERAAGPTVHADEPLHGLDSQCTKLMDVLDRTVTSQGNSAVFLLGACAQCVAHRVSATRRRTGPRGSGKSAVLKHCLRALKRKYTPQGRSFVEVGRLQSGLSRLTARPQVYLNGFLQTDDALALRCADDALSAACRARSAHDRHHCVHCSEICRQLQLENDLEIEGGRHSGAFHNQFSFLLHVLESSRRANLPVFFVSAAAPCVARARHALIDWRVPRQ
jgi:hypothetical protein